MTERATRPASVVGDAAAFAVGTLGQLASSETAPSLVAGLLGGGLRLCTLSAPAGALEARRGDVAVLARAIGADAAYVTLAGTDGSGRASWLGALAVTAGGVHVRQLLRIHDSGAGRLYERVGSVHELPVGAGVGPGVQMLLDPAEARLWCGGHREADDAVATATAARLRAAGVHVTVTLAALTLVIAPEPFDDRGLPALHPGGGRSTTAQHLAAYAIQAAHHHVRAPRLALFRRGGLLAAVTCPPVSVGSAGSIGADLGLLALSVGADGVAIVLSRPGGPDGEPLAFAMIAQGPDATGPAPRLLDTHDEEDTYGPLFDPVALGIQGASLDLEPDVEAAWQSVDDLELAGASVALSWPLTARRLRARFG